MKKLLILGAGYASLAFLKSLNKKVIENLEIELVTKEDYHYTSILLHEVAVGSRGSVCFNLSEIVPKQVRVIKDEIVEICHGRVLGRSAEYPYDYLVVGLGFSSDNFGIEGVREHSYSMVDFESARILKDKIFNQIHEFRRGDEEALNFAVCGAGFSGIEFAASLAESLKKETKAFNISDSKISITCIEAMPNILPMFSPNLARKALIKLEDMGVRFSLGSKILKIDADGVVIEKDNVQSRIRSRVSIWTAGVKGNEVIANSSFFTSGRSKITVDEYLHPINKDNQEQMNDVYVIGDCAALLDPSSGRFYPPTAQLAIKEGEYLGLAFSNRVFGFGVEKFNYKSQGTVCSLGDLDGIGLIGGYEIAGRPSMFVKRLIEKKWLYKLLGLRGIFR